MTFVSVVFSRRRVGDDSFVTTCQDACAALTRLRGRLRLPEPVATPVRRRFEA